MSQDPSRLDLDRARGALIKARTESAIAVRAPRPADLSRLREEEDRRHRIETRAGAFRMEVRSALGLSDTSGPYSPLPVSASGVLGASLCDADICTPEAPVLKSEAVPAAHEAPPLKSETREPQALSGETIDAPAAPEMTDMAEAEALEAPEPEARAKRKKFLGIF